MHDSPVSKSVRRVLFAERNSRKTLRRRRRTMTIICPSCSANIKVHVAFGVCYQIQDGREPSKELNVMAAEPVMSAPVYIYAMGEARRSW